jgi:hypothetical protein
LGLYKLLPLGKYKKTKTDPPNDPRDLAVTIRPHYAALAELNFIVSVRHEDNHTHLTVTTPHYQFIAVLGHNDPRVFQTLRHHPPLETPSVSEEGERPRPQREERHVRIRSSPYYPIPIIIEDDSEGSQPQSSTIATDPELLVPPPVVLPYHIPEYALREVGSGPPLQRIDETETEQSIISEPLPTY